MAGNFEASLKRVLVHEGGYSNDAGDPGGRTMWGITHIDYDAYRRRKGEEPQDVRRMSIAERDEIYRKKYWTGGRCEELPSGVDYCVFDGAVNSGVAQSAKWLQRALGVHVDGHIGDQTLLAATEADPHHLISAICEQRRKFLRSLRTFPRFGRGWIRRVDDVEHVASSMAIDPVEPVPHARATEAGAKASATDLGEPLVSQGTATATTAATASGSAVVQQIQEQLSPFSDALSVIKYVLMACAVVGLGFTIYAILKSNRLKEVS